MMKKRLRRQSELRDEERQKREDIERKYDSVKHLKRKGMETEALSLQNSKVHYSKEGSELTEDLQNMAKGKIITHG